MCHLIDHVLLDVGDLLVYREGRHSVVGDNGHVEADGGGRARQQAPAASLHRRRAQTAALRALALGVVIALQAVQAETVTTRQLARFTKVLRAQAAC